MLLLLLSSGERYFTLVFVLVLRSWAKRTRTPTGSLASALLERPSSLSSATVGAPFHHSGYPAMTARAHAFGSTIIMAPSCSFKMATEDAALFPSYLKQPGLAVLVTSECQPTSRAVGKQAVAELVPMLSSGAQRLAHTDNAGGSSRISEALSIELLHRAFGAELQKCELELKYWPANGAITDFAISLEGRCYGVSVTRAMAVPNTMYTIEAAEGLLRKKLNGVLRSTETCCSDTFEKQILHVWAQTEPSSEVVRQAYLRLEPSLTADTVVLITVCSLNALFTEKAQKLPGGARILKGAKDERHLRALRESDPVKHNGRVVGGYEGCSACGGGETCTAI